MKIYFCDECHESIPLKDIADNTITIEGGKIYHEKCRPKAAKPGGRVSYSTAAVSLLLGLGVGAVIMAIWGDAILGREKNDSITRKLTHIESTLAELEHSTNTRLQAIEKDLEESPALDGKAGKLARTLQDVSDNGDSVIKLSRKLNGLTDELRTEQENQSKDFAGEKAKWEKQMAETVNFVKDRIVPDLQKTIEKVDTSEETVADLTDRLDDLEANGVTRAPSEGSKSPVTGPAPGPALTLNPEKTKRRQELLDQLKNKDGPKRFAAAVDLGEFKDRQVATAMVGLLDDPADYVRSTALNNLMDMDARWTIPHIIPILKTDDYVLRETAIAALEKLMGRSIALDPDANSAKVLAKIRELNKWWDKNKDKIIEAE